MKQHFIIQKSHTNLLLFFTGWGMDETPFSFLQPANCDWMICYDYRSLSFDDNLLRPYTNIHLIAWSMGVWAASHIMEHYPHLPISQCTAINGTPFPVDETKGIPPAIFDGTLKGLDNQSLQKFQRRMCGSSTEYKYFQSIAPQRSIKELKEELAAIRQQVTDMPPSSLRWTKVFIGKNDHIFLPDHQQMAWKELTDTLIYSDAAHYNASLFEKEIQSTDFQTRALNP